MYKSIRNTNGVNQISPFSTQNTSAQVNYEKVQEAIVIDVVTNDTHKEYAADGYNVGAIQFRLLKSNTFREKATLNWAFPLDTNISEYPLKQEIVVITEYLNRFYYTKKINVTNRVTSHALPGLDDELSPIPSSQKKVEAYQNTTVNPIRSKSNTNILGDYFKNMDSVYRLRHSEGDMIWEGRSGQSIRLGAAWKAGTIFTSTDTDQAPNIIMRVGQNSTEPKSVNTPYGLVTENINADASSLWITADQNIPLKYSTKDSTIHGDSIKDIPSVLLGNQIVLNTDRFVINTKNNKIFGFSGKGIHWTTLQNYTVDVDVDYISSIKNNQTIKIGNNATYTISGFSETSAKDHISLISKKVYVGTQSDEIEPVVCGASLAQFLQDFIDAHLMNTSNHVVTSMGPGILSPAVVTALTKLKKDVATGKYASFNSKVAYTTKEK